MIRLDRALTHANVHIASNEAVSQYEGLIQDIVRNIFHMQPYDVCITDESWLSDFSACCMPDEEFDKTLSPMEINKICDNEMKSKFKDIYGVDVNPHESFVDVCARIEDQHGKI